MSRRGHILIGLAISVGVVLLLYYPLHATVQTLAEDVYLPGAYLHWIPNAVIGIIGAALLIRIARK